MFFNRGGREKHKHLTSTNVAKNYTLPLLMGDSQYLLCDVKLTVIPLYHLSFSTLGTLALVDFDRIRIL